MAAVRVKRGSITIICALRLRLASIAHLNPHGWFSAGLPPMINIMSVLLDVHPAIGHRTASKRGPQTGDRWTVSNPGLVFYIGDARELRMVFTAR